MERVGRVVGLTPQKPGAAAQSYQARRATDTRPPLDVPPATRPELRGTLLVGPDGLAEAVVGVHGGETLTERNHRAYAGAG